MSLSTAEIICLGNELLMGETINTNGAYIGKNLTKIGFAVRRITCVRDDLDLASEAFKEIFSRSPTIVIVSGGLGPTYDDIQLFVLSEATGKQLVLNEQALRQVKKYYAKKGHDLSKERKKMAYLPEGSQPLPNGVGGAPGCVFKYKETLIFCLPGVPSEMKDIFTKQVLPRLSAEFGKKISEVKFVVYNLIESELAPIINGVKEEYPSLYIKSHPEHKNREGILFHIMGSGESGKKQVKEAKKRLITSLKNNFSSIELKVKYDG